MRSQWIQEIAALLEANFARGFRHPESGRDFRLDPVLANYAWHGMLRMMTALTTVIAASRATMRSMWSEHELGTATLELE